MRAAAVVLLCAILAGCAGTPAVQIPAEVKVPVPVACLDPDRAPVPPAAPAAADLLAMDDYRRTLAIWIWYVRLQAYVLEAAAVIDRCGRIPAPRPPAPVKSV